MAPLVWIAAGIALLVGLIALESRRQARVLARRGEPRGVRPSLIGTGLLELQALLEPERKVETIQADMRRRDRDHPGHRAARPADGEPGEVSVTRRRSRR